MRQRPLSRLVNSAATGLPAYSLAQLRQGRHRREALRHLARVEDQALVLELGALSLYPGLHARDELRRQGLDLACRLVRGAAQRVFRLRPVPAPGRDERRYLSRPARHRGAQVLKGRPRRVAAAGREQEQHERCH